MKKNGLLIFFLVFFGFVVFSQTGSHEEIDFLLFLPNSGETFVDEDRAWIQLNNIAKYLKERDIAPGQVIVYGYTAFAANDVDAEDLSRQRALSVIAELQKRGVSRNLFADPVGHGSVYLWGSNTEEEDKAPNRRVRILVDGKVIVPQVIAEPEPEPVLPVIRPAEEPAAPVAVKKKSGFQWLLLLLVLLIPLFFLLFRMLKNKNDEEPAAINEPVPAPAPPPPAPAPDETVVDTVDLEEEIRRRAYFRSQGHGEYSDVDQDWFVELPKVCAEYEAKGYRTYMENGTWWAKKTIVKK